MKFGVFVVPERVGTLDEESTNSGVAAARHRAYEIQVEGNSVGIATGPGHYKGKTMCAHAFVDSNVEGSAEEGSASSPARRSRSRSTGGTGHRGPYEQLVRPIVDEVCCGVALEGFAIVDGTTRSRLHTLYGSQSGYGGIVLSTLEEFRSRQDEGTLSHLRMSFVELADKVNVANTTSGYPSAAAEAFVDKFSSSSNIINGRPPLSPQHVVTHQHPSSSISGATGSPKVVEDPVHYTTTIEGCTMLKVDSEGMNLLQDQIDPSRLQILSIVANRSPVALGGRGSSGSSLATQQTTTSTQTIALAGPKNAAVLHFISLPHRDQRGQQQQQCPQPRRQLSELLGMLSIREGPPKPQIFATSKLNALLKPALLGAEPSCWIASFNPFAPPSSLSSSLINDEEFDGETSADAQSIISLGSRLGKVVGRNFPAALVAPPLSSPPRSASHSTALLGFDEPHHGRTAAFGGTGFGSSSPPSDSPPPPATIRGSSASGGNGGGGGIPLRGSPSAPEPRLPAEAPRPTSSAVGRGRAAPAPGAGLGLGESSSGDSDSEFYTYQEEEDHRTSGSVGVGVGTKRTSTAPTLAYSGQGDLSSPSSPQPEAQQQAPPQLQLHAQQQRTGRAVHQEGTATHTHKPPPPTGVLPLEPATDGQHHHRHQQQQQRTPDSSEERAVPGVTSTLHKTASTNHKRPPQSSASPPSAVAAAAAATLPRQQSTASVDSSSAAPSGGQITRQSTASKFAASPTTDPLDSVELRSQLKFAEEQRRSDQAQLKSFENAIKRLERQLADQRRGGSTGTSPIRNLEDSNSRSPVGTPTIIFNSKGTFGSSSSGRQASATTFGAKSQQQRQVQKRQDSETINSGGAANGIQAGAATAKYEAYKEAMEPTLQRLRSHVDEAQAKAESTNKQLQKKLKQLQQAQDNSEKWRSELDSANERVAELEESLSEAHSNSHFDLTAAERRAQKAEVEVEDLQREQADLQDALTEMTVANGKLREQLRQQAAEYRQRYESTSTQAGDGAALATGAGIGTRTAAVQTKVSSYALDEQILFLSQQSRQLEESEATLLEELEVAAQRERTLLHRVASLEESDSHRSDTEIELKNAAVKLERSLSEANARIATLVQQRHDEENERQEEGAERSTAARKKKSETEDGKIEERHTAVTTSPTIGSPRTGSFRKRAEVDEIEMAVLRETKVALKQQLDQAHNRIGDLEETNGRLLRELESARSEARALRGAREQEDVLGQEKATPNTCEKGVLCHILIPPSQAKRSQSAASSTAASGAAASTAGGRTPSPSAPSSSSVLHQPAVARGQSVSSAKTSGSGHSQQRPPPLPLPPPRAPSAEREREGGMSTRKHDRRSVATRAPSVPLPQEESLVRASTSNLFSPPPPPSSTAAAEHYRPSAQDMQLLDEAIHRSSSRVSLTALRSPSI